MNRRGLNILAGTLAFSLVPVSIWLGYQWADSVNAPVIADLQTQVKTAPVTVEKITEKPVYIDREVIKEVEVEKVVYRNKVYRDWQSVEEFVTWYNAQGFFPLFPYLPDQCEVYAERVQRVALEQGYPVSTVETNASGYYADSYIGKSYHAGGKVTIGNEIFYVETNPGEFRMIKVMNRN